MAVKRSRMLSSTKILFIALFASLTFFQFPLSDGYSASLGLTIINNCKDVVWPGILSATGTLSSTGFALQPRDSHTFYVSSNWAGRIWGRTQCSYNFTHLFSCVTADCGSSTIQCNGLPTPPVTLAEFTLKGTSGIHDYDVSLVHGFNLPMWVEPHTNSGDRKCMETGCDKNLIEACPEELKVIREGKRVGCKRMACQAPSCLDSQFYKAECPRAHVYSNDHASCTCSASHFTITFCPNRSIKPGNKKSPPAVESVGGSADSSPFSIKTMFIAVASICACGGLVIVCRIVIRARGLDCDIRFGARAQN